MNLFIFLILISLTSFTFSNDPWDKPVEIRLGDWAPNAVKVIGRDEFETRDKWTNDEEARTNTPPNQKTFPRCLNDLRKRMLPRERPTTSTTEMTTTTEEPWQQCGLKNSMVAASEDKIKNGLKNRLYYLQGFNGAYWPYREPFTINTKYNNYGIFTYQIGNFDIKSGDIYEQCYSYAIPDRYKGLHIYGCFDCDQKYAKNYKVINMYLYVYFNCFGWNDGGHGMWLEAPAMTYMAKGNIYTTNEGIRFDLATIINNSPLAGNMKLTMFQCYMCKYDGTDDYFTFSGYSKSAQNTFFLVVEHTCAPGQAHRFQAIRLDGVVWSANEPNIIKYENLKIVLCNEWTDKKCYETETQWVESMFNHMHKVKSYNYEDDMAAYKMVDWNYNVAGDTNYKKPDELAQLFGYKISEVHDSQKVNPQG